MDMRGTIDRTISGFEIIGFSFTDSIKLISNFISLSEARNI